MTVEFIRAAELKKQFEVLAHFYSVDVRGSDSIRCRSVLEMRRRSLPSGSAVDAVVIMMNPGSSRPVVEEEVLVAPARLAAMEDTLKPAVPDTTQYQIMRVMHYMKWGHVRVINLSDLRDSKSDSFVGRYMRLEQDFGLTSHSVFAPERRSQLRRYLERREGAPVIRAWGVGQELLPLIERASKALVGEGQLTGWEKPEHQGRFYHPLPTLQSQKELWVAQTLAQLGEGRRSVL